MAAAIISALLLMAGRYVIKFMQSRPRSSPQVPRGANYDPASAGATLLVLTAMAREGQVSPAEREVIETAMTEEFGVRASAAAGLFSYGRMAAGQVEDPFRALGGLLRPIRAACTTAECAAFVGMMERVATVGGTPTREASMLIEECRDALTLESEAGS